MDFFVPDFKTKISRGFCDTPSLDIQYLSVASSLMVAYYLFCIAQILYCMFNKSWLQVLLSMSKWYPSLDLVFSSLILCMNSLKSMLLIVKPFLYSQ